MIALRDWTAGNRVALALACAATLCAGVELARIRRALPRPQSASGTRVELPLLAGTSEAPAASLARTVEAVVDVDPFRPDRTRPARRFRGLADRHDASLAESATAAAPSTPAPAAMALRGIARLANGTALAVLSVRGGATQLLRVGESLDRYRLTHVDSASVTVAGPDSTIVLRLPNATPGTAP